MAKVTTGSFNTGSYTNSGITRYLTFRWERTSYSVANNTSTISWTLKGGGSSGWMYCGGFTVIIDGTTVYHVGTDTRIQVYEGTTCASGTTTIKHNNDGTKKFSASASAAIWTTAVNKEGSGSWELESIPRQATISAAPNFNDEDNPTITYSNPAGNAVDSLQACISLTGSTADIPYRSISKTGISYTFNLTTAERNILRNATTGSKSRSVRFYVRTVINGTTYNDYLSKTFSVVNGAPVLSSTVVDTNSATIALTGDSNKLVKYYSNAAATVNAAAQKGASITAQQITYSGKTVAAASTTINGVETGTFKFSATDNRKNTTTKTVTKTLINYVKLSCNINVTINTAGEATIQTQGNYFNGNFGATSNTLTVQYRYKLSGGSYGSWTTLTATKSGNTYTADTTKTGLNYQKTYVFQARATDKLVTKNSKEIAVKSQPVFDWGAEDFAFHVPAAAPSLAVDNNGYKSVITTAATADRVVSLPNKAGTIAFTSDLPTAAAGYMIVGGYKVCWGSFTATMGATSAAGSVYSSDSTLISGGSFASAFAAAPTSVIVGLKGSATTILNYAPITVNASGITKVRVWRTGTSTGYDVDLYYIAFGKA